MQVYSLQNRPDAGGWGIPEAMGVLEPKNPLKPGSFSSFRNIFKTYFAKFISCVCAVSSGIPVGPEDPMIHMGLVYKNR